MDQNDLESLLASLRQQQDAPAVPPQQPAAAPDASAYSDHSTAIPSQAQLDALLSSLTALPDTAASSGLPANTSRTKDVSDLTFPESLPILHSLALDKTFLDRIEALWDQQKNWELRMKDERNRLEQEATREGLSAQLRTMKLKEWDKSTLKRWEKLQTSQQESLRAMGVPTFQATRDLTILKRQERVMKVLVGFIEDREDDEDA